MIIDKREKNIKSGEDGIFKDVIINKFFSKFKIGDNIINFILIMSNKHLTKIKGENKIKKVKKLKI